MGPGEKLVAVAARRPFAFFATFTLLAVLAGVAESGIARLRSMNTEPGLGARWIWAQNVVRAGEPLTFYAARDFELEEGVEKAWLSLAASESYVLWVNGQAVGSGIWRDGSKVADLYELSDWLERGHNRLVVELRSATGAGGLLATLRFGELGHAALVTDAHWRIFRQAEPRLLRGLARLEELEGGEEPQLWQWPPTGRWRLDRLVARPDLRAADPLYGRVICPQRLGFPSAITAWSDLPESVSCNLPSLSDQSLWDFGQEVEGILEMDLVPSEEPATAMIYFLSEEPVDLTKIRPDIFLQAAPKAWYWRAASVRRFRYLAIVGTKPQGFLRLQPVSSQQKEAYQPPPLPEGAFGIDAPAGQIPLERSIWDRYLPAN